MILGGRRHKKQPRYYGFKTEYRNRLTEECTTRVQDEQTTNNSNVASGLLLVRNV
jgi:hypothetical protein